MTQIGENSKGLLDQRAAAAESWSQRSILNSLCHPSRIKALTSDLGVESNTIFLRQKESSKNPQNTVLQFLREPVKYYNLVLINSFSAKFGQRILVQKHHFHLVFDGLP